MKLLKLEKIDAPLRPNDRVCLQFMYNDLERCAWHQVSNPVAYNYSFLIDTEENGVMIIGLCQLDDNMQCICFESSVLSNLHLQIMNLLSIDTNFDEALL